MYVAYNNYILYIYVYNYVCSMWQWSSMPDNMHPYMVYMYAILHRCHCN